MAQNQKTQHTVVYMWFRWLNTGRYNGTEPEDTIDSRVHVVQVAEY